MNYYIGTAGFSYRDWEGIFYPKAVDKLNYYSSIFNFVEINSTFYEIPEEKFFISLSSRLKNNFRISIKANKLFTHNEDLSLGELKKFFELIKILEKNLLCILFQYPYSFHYNKENISKIEKIKNISDNILIAIEIRHKSFLNEDFLKFCKENNIIYVNIDQPQVSYNVPLTSYCTNSHFSYFRFHGRKEKTWFANNIESYERYNYLYKDEEIDGLKKALDNNPANNIIISFNNHYKAKAVINALQLMEKLGEKPKISSQQIIKSMNRSENTLL